MELLKEGGLPATNGTGNVVALEARRQQKWVNREEFDRLQARLASLEMRLSRQEADGHMLKTCCPVARNIFRLPAD